MAALICPEGKYFANIGQLLYCRGLKATVASSAVRRLTERFCKRTTALGCAVFALFYLLSFDIIYDCIL